MESPDDWGRWRFRSAGKLEYEGISLDKRQGRMEYVKLCLYRIYRTFSMKQTKKGITMRQLSDQVLPTLKDTVDSVPEYDRSSLEPSIVHIGLGHFHRAHFLTYLDTLLSQGLTRSGVFEVDIPPSSDTFIDSLKAQDYLYSVLAWGSDGSRNLRINGPILGYANATKEPELVLEKLSDPDTRLVTMTITEKGYYYLDDQRTLDFEAPLVMNDLMGTGPYPRTAVGYLSAALAIRYRDDAPLTIMSCDNIPENGTVLKRCVLQFCEKRYPDIVDWVEGHVAFPCTMVDRITPGTTESDISVIETIGGYHDACPVHCEDFLQWVIEDTKATDIPDFSAAGAMVVDDVRPYELMKIRLLNGSHSALSYPSYLLGMRDVDQAATDPLIHEFIRNRYMEEITETLPPVPGIDLTSYKDSLMDRFANTYIKDSVLRLAGDGSKKIANAIVRPLEEAIQAGTRHDAMIFALVVWARFCQGKDERGCELPVDDPLRDALLSACRNPKEFLSLAGVNSLSERQMQKLVDEFTVYAEEVESQGVRRALTSFLRDQVS